MASNQEGQSRLPAGTALEERLERGEIIHYPVCPFPVAEGDDRQFLLQQRLGNKAHKNISYDPSTGKAGGFLRQSAEQAERLRLLLVHFADTATAWLARTLPRYAPAWQRDRVSFRPEEEATRRLRQKARNDLLHVDAFPSRPTQGRRILRLFVNINPTEPRIWVTSDPFAKLLERFGKEAGLPGTGGTGLAANLGAKLLGLFQPGRRRRTVYDTFMLRFHDFLKANEDFQERGPKRFWTFMPGCAWMVFTDTASHAALRGRFALEHSYFVAPESLALPQESPPALLQRACGRPVLDRAA
jgi:3-deoxy-D-manno-oct-2-ulosonic acid (Kdo) hydroxylase